MPAKAGLFERSRERTVLAWAVDRAHAGHGSVVLVEGAAGLGKTALMELTAELASARGLRALRARGSEIERDVPFITLRGLFERELVACSAERREALLTGVAEPLARALGLGEPGPVGYARLHGAAQSLIVQFVQDGPLALLVDDLHHADASSLAALAAIARHLDELPVVMVLTRRPEDCGCDPAALEDLALVAGVPLTPQPLTLAGVGAVLRDRAGETIDHDVVALGKQATGGNPFLVVQLARALHETGQPLELADVGDVMAGVAQSLSAVLRVRVGRLGPDATTLARTVAVLGDDVSVTEACAVGALEREAALVAAAALAGAGIFASDRVNCFAHPIVRAAVEADLMAAERTLIEERAVAVLLAADAEPARIAVHLLRTEATGEARAVAALRVAAASASGAAASSRAVLLLRRALAEQPESPVHEALLGELVSAELCCGEYASAAEHLRRRLPLISGCAERAADARRLSRTLLELGDAAAASSTIADALAGAEGDARLMLEAEQLWTSALVPGASPPDGLKRYGDLRGHTDGERAMLAALAISHAAHGGSFDVVAALLERCFRDDALLGAEGSDSPLYALAAYLLVACDRSRMADAEMTRALDAARASGSAGAVAMALTIRGLARLRLGRLREAEDDGLGGARAAAASSGMVRALTTAIAVGVVVDARAERGDDEGARAVLAEHGFDGELSGDPQLRALMPRARAHLAAGRAAEALADARRASASLTFDAHVLAGPDSVISLAQSLLGERSAAIAAARVELERAHRRRVPSAIACALRVLGLALGDAGGISLLQDALRVLESSSADLERAHCHVALGMLWRRTGQRSRALESLRAGADIAQRLGAGVVAQRAREGLLVLGSRPRRLAFTGADALTASERRAAQLAAAGRTNREIAQELYLSVKTVESHLGRGFRKLGISSRTELAGALSQRSASG